MIRALNLLLTILVAAPQAIGESELSYNYRGDLAAKINAAVEKHYGEWFEFYRHLHEHPELSLQEKESSRHIAERLESFGYDVTTNVGGHGVVGVLANGNGPTVLVRGDMDALPIVEETGLPYASTRTAKDKDGVTVGVMHACGHDVHQVNLVATARLLADLREHWSGTLVVIAQPAEEIGMGARMMIEDGLFERFARPDYCIAMHVAADQPAGEVGCTLGWALANVDSVDITIHGRGGHGSTPQDAVDPIVMASHVVTALQTIVSRRLSPLEPGVITVGAIHGGSKHNIIPDSVKLKITVRSYTDSARMKLLDGIRDITVGTCRALGSERDPEVEISEEEFTPATFNHPALTRAAMDVMGQVIGRENVLQKEQRMGGEDFGRYGKHLDVPSLMFFVGSVNRDVYEASREPGGAPLPSLHSSKYMPDPKPTITTAARCMTHLALSLLEKR